MEGDEDLDRVGTEAQVAADVANVANDVAGQLDEIDIGARCDFSGDDDEVGRAEGFTGDAGQRVLSEEGIEDAIGDLVGHLVRVSHADRFTGDQKLRHDSFVLKLRSHGGG